MGNNIPGKKGIILYLLTTQNYRAGKISGWYYHITSSDVVTSKYTEPKRWNTDEIIYVCFIIL